jgi:hypothetical protein
VGAESAQQIARVDAAAQFHRQFLEMRHRLLDLAAALDRIDRAGGAAEVGLDPRMTALLCAASILTDGQPDRAERVQMLFSRPYDPTWRDG